MPRPGSLSEIKVRETAFALNHSQPWTDEEIEKVMADNMHDYELSKELNRSINAIRIKRCYMNKKRVR